MRNLLNFFLKYNYWFLFILLEVISFALLFRFNNYQGSAFFTSSNQVAGMAYEAANNVTGYFHLKSINDDLVQKNVELELQMERLRFALMELTSDSTELERMKSDALKGYDIYRANVINNSLTHVDNYITLDKGENDGIRSEMGVINGSGVVGIVYHTSSNYSVVIPILNSKSSISCKIKRSDYFGFLKWDGGSSEYATVKDMPRHSLFSLGDTIVTSGHSAVFPGGIPIGTVEDMSDSHDGLSYLLKVKLFTDFGRLNDVRVIAQKGQEEQLELEQKVKGGRK
jgi:rod shape-determining protein MreC